MSAVSKAASDSGHRCRTSPDVIDAQDIILSERQGGIDGVVLDPLGRPFGGAEIISSRRGVPYTATTSKFDGSFSLRRSAARRVGTDRTPGRWPRAGTGRLLRRQLRRPKCCSADTGRSPRFGWSVRVWSTSRSAAQTGTTWAQVYYRPTYYSEATKASPEKAWPSRPRPEPNGFLRSACSRLANFEITVYSPFHGVRTVGGQIEWAGQVKNIDVVFDGSSSVAGQLVNVDGVTPIPYFDVDAPHREDAPAGSSAPTPRAGSIFDLVPEGRLEVRAEGMVGDGREGRGGDGLSSAVGSQHLELRCE